MYTKLPSACSLLGGLLVEGEMGVGTGGGLGTSTVIAQRIVVDLPGISNMDGMHQTKCQ